MKNKLKYKLKRVFIHCICVFCLICVAVSGCGTSLAVDNNPQSQTPREAPERNTTDSNDKSDSNDANSTDSAFLPAEQEPVTAVLPEYDPTPEIYEAEEQTLIGGTRVENSLDGFSGTGYAAGFENEGDALEFTVTIKETGFYDLNFITSTGKNGYKENYVFVNGENAGIVAANSEDFTDSVIERMYFEAGENKILYEKYWGWMYLDRLEVVKSPPQDPEIFNVSPNLVNANASDSAKRLMLFLTDTYGKYILSGQYSELGVNGKEIFTLRGITGKNPAVLGLDLIDYTPSRAANGAQSKTVEYAVEFHEMGGIVTLCWHWNAPEEYLTGIWWRGFYTDATNIDLKKIMDGDDEEGYALLLRDIDAIAEQLKILQDNDVPILWRPLHEASGGWFWWGAKGPEANIALWKLLYERLTVHHELNNLIWVWNGQSADWYPGDEYVDIVGEDIYAGEHVYSSQIGKFTEAIGYTNGRKMVVLSECGTVPDPDLLVRDGAMWGFYAAWQGEFVLRGGLNRYSEQYTEQAIIEKVYNHENVLTLDRLPDLKTYGD